MKTFRWLRLWVVISCIAALLSTARPAQSFPDPTLPPDVSPAPAAADTAGNFRWDIQRAASHHITEPFDNNVTHHSHSFVLDGQGHPHLVYGKDRLYYAFDDGSGWQIESVDGLSLAGVSSASLALDNSGSPLASYCRDGQLMLARRSSLGIWTLEAVDSACTWTSIAINNGLPNIAYSTGANLRYAIPSLSGWDCQTLASAGSGYAIGDVNLIIAADAAIHIGYYQGAGQGDQIMYLRSNASGWDAPLMVVKGIYNQLFGMAVDDSHLALFSYVRIDGDQGGLGAFEFARRSPSGPDPFVTFPVRELAVDESIDCISMGLAAGYYPVMAYYRQTWGDLGVHDYVSYSEIIDASGASVSQDITEIRQTSPYVNLVLDQPGAAQVAFMDNARLFLGTAGTPWSYQEIDADVYYLYQTSLALNSADLGRLSYYNWGTEDLMFAAENASGGWEAEAVDTGGNVGSYNSLAIGPDGEENIAYYDATHGELKVTYHGPGGWTPPVVVDGGGVGQYVSLKMDRDSLWHISYYDAANKDLKYAYFQAGWHTGVVDSAGDVGLYSSLVLDGSDAPHIAYYDATLGALKYTYPTGDTWNTAVLDDPVDGTQAGIGISLAALPDGFAVAYVVHSASGSTLKYKRCLFSLGSCSWSASETVADGVEIHCVTPVDDAVTGVSLGVNAAGKAYIAYYTGTLRVATQSGSQWLNERPDPGATAEGAHASLAIDSQGKPHVSYLDGAFFGVRVARLKNDLNAIFLPVLKK